MLKLLFFSLYEHFKAYFSESFKMRILYITRERMCPRNPCFQFKRRYPTTIRILAVKKIWDVDNYTWTPMYVANMMADPELIHFVSTESVRSAQ